MPVLSTEVQLLGWAKSTSKSGPKVVLLLQSDDEIAFFESLTLAKGKTAGQILDVNFKLSPQDDQSHIFGQSSNIINVSKKEFEELYPELPADGPFIDAALPKPKTGLRCREAVGLMKEKDFSDYVKFVNMEFNGNDTPKEFMQIMCGISSRRELDEGPDADKKYAKFCEIKRAYRKWQEGKK